MWIVKLNELFDSSYTHTLGNGDLCATGLIQCNLWKKLQHKCDLQPNTVRAMCATPAVKQWFAEGVFPVTRLCLKWPFKRCHFWWVLNDAFGTTLPVLKLAHCTTALMCTAKVGGMWDRAIDLLCPPKRLPMFGSADDSFLGYRLSGWLAANAVVWVQIV